MKTQKRKYPDARGGTYKLAYGLWPQPKGITRSQIRKFKGKANGATDALFYASMIFPPDGSLSVLFGGVDGRKTKPPYELEDIEWFKVWAMLSHRLAQSTTLDDNRKAFCQSAFDAVRKAVMAGREECPHGHPECLNDNQKTTARNGRKTATQGR